MKLCAIIVPKVTSIPDNRLVLVLVDQRDPQKEETIVKQPTHERQHKRIGVLSPQRQFRAAYGYSGELRMNLSLL